MFYKLFSSISQNKPGRYKVPFIVMRHRFQNHLRQTLNYRTVLNVIDDILPQNVQL